MTVTSVFTSLVAGLLGGVQAAEPAPHPCAADALSRAEPLLLFHWGEDPPRIDLDETVRVVASVGALRGSGEFDVLETSGHVYRTSYRMRFIYARIPDACVLMGQEILEESDPY